MTHARHAPHRERAQLAELRRRIADRDARRWLAEIRADWTRADLEPYRVAALAELATTGPTP